MREVSVIIPVYNVEPYLRPCLDSVVGQTFRDVEIICVDDGSTDGSLAILNEYAQRDRRIMVIEAVHANAGAARNIGFRASSGRCLLFLDADDVFAPTMIETLHAALLRNHADIANCAKQDFLSGTELPNLATGNVDNFELLDNSRRKVNCFKEFVGWSWDKLFTRELVEHYDLHFQEQQAHNDFFFCNCACCLADRIVRTKDVFIAHRKHETSIAVNRDKSPLCFSSALRGFYQKLDVMGFWLDNPNQLRFFNNYVVELGFWTIDTLKCRESIELAYCELRRILKEQGALDKDKTYMSIYPHWFQKYQCLCKHEDVLLFWRDAALAERNAAKWLQKQRVKQDGEVRRMEGELERMNIELDKCRAEVFSLKKSFAYRVGMALTFPIRKFYHRLKGV